jgi:hypothetical protein
VAEDSVNAGSRWYAGRGDTVLNMLLYSLRHVGGNLNGTVVDVKVGPDGQVRFELRELHVVRPRCDAGTGGLAPVMSRSTQYVGAG